MREASMLRFASLLCSLIISISLAAAQTTAPPDSRLNRIAAEKTVRIAYRSDARPFSFQNPSNEASGFVVDLCRLVVLSMQHQFGALTIEWVPVSVQDRFSVVVTGKADMECGSSTITLGRMKEVDFSNPVFVESTGLLVMKTSGVDSFEQMTGKKIAVISGTTNEAAVLSQVKAHGLPVSVLSVADRDAGVNALESGQADAFASDKLLLSLEVYGIALPRGDWALRLAVNTGLAQIYRSGKIVDVFGVWFGQVGLQPGPLLKSLYAINAIAD
jgi:ABC-type amino acid transport substrate-binding protein